jgi:hypothetical protein
LQHQLLLLLLLLFLLCAGSVAGAMGLCSLFGM